MKSASFQTPSHEVSCMTDSYVIAEIGNNHQGSVDTCIEMFVAAKTAGADAVKLQKRNNRDLYTHEAYGAHYNSENAFGETYGSHRDYLEFDEAQYIDLFAAADEIGITLFATAFDFSSADFLEKLNCPMYKIASGDLRTEPLIKHVAGYGKPLIISTGGADTATVRKVYDYVSPINENICFLQCTALILVQPRI